MKYLRRVFLRFFSLFTNSKAEAELDREIAAHLRLLEDDFLDRGMTPEEARRAARRAYGGVEQVKQLHRNERAYQGLASTVMDVQYTLRQLRKSPGFTLTAILVLAFGIGATAAVFSIVQGVLLRPLPFPEQERLVTLGDALDGVDYGGATPGVTAPGSQIYMRDTGAFSSLGAYQTKSYELSGTGYPTQIRAARITGSIFQVLEVPALLGRTFTQEDDNARQQVVVLSYRLWQQQFHGDRGILGQKILLDRTPYEVVGVMPRDFEFPLVPGQLNQSELWVPVSFAQSELTKGAGNWDFYMVGRLKPGVSVQRAQQDAANAAREVMRSFPPALASRHFHPALERLDEATVAQARPLIRTLFLAVLVVLLIACTNLAGLLLLRTIRRRHDISVRLALGATPRDVIMQPLVEALTLSIAGGVLGLILAVIVVRIGVSFLPETLPRIDSIGPNWWVMGFAVGMALLTGLLCGSIPAFAATRTAVNETLKEGGRTGTSGGGHSRLRSALVTIEIAVALVLLTSAGLLLMSLEKMRSVNLGFVADHTLTASYSLPREEYSTQNAIDNFQINLRNKLLQSPGVEDVGFTSMLPAAGNNLSTGFTPEGYVSPKGVRMNLAWMPQVSVDYFEAQGIPIARGRSFTMADTLPDAQLVAVVNRTLVQHYWPGQDPIGKRLHVGPPQADVPWITVVGEIGDVKQLAADAPTREQAYMLSNQFRRGIGQFATPDLLVGDSGTIVLRGQLPPDQMIGILQNALRSLDPQLALKQIESMNQVIDEGRAPRRFNTILLSGAAGAAVILAILGIYSVMAFSVTLRTQEIAIRLALGAQRRAVLRLILASGAKLGLAGCAIGLVGTVLATGLLRSLLFQVQPLDPPIIVVACLGLFGMAMLATAIPARRAASIDPVKAMRVD